MRRIATFAASAALLAAAVLPVMANGGNECTNDTTGPFSNNNCTVNNTSNITVKNYNDAVIINNVTSRANSGGNSTSYNTLGGTISTGDASLNTAVSSVANVNTTNITGGPAMSGNMGSNNITGPYSDNDVIIQNTQRLRVDNQN